MYYHVGGPPGLRPAVRIRRASRNSPAESGIPTENEGLDQGTDHGMVDVDGGASGSGGDTDEETQRYNEIAMNAQNLSPSDREKFDKMVVELYRALFVDTFNPIHPEQLYPMLAEMKNMVGISPTCK